MTEDICRVFQSEVYNSMWKTDKRTAEMEGGKSGRTLLLMGGEDGGGLDHHGCSGESSTEASRNWQRDE